MVEIASLSRAEFIEALRRGTDGMWAVDAAVWLLEQHGVWLDDSRLRQFAVGGTDTAGNLWAGLDIPGMGAALETRTFGPWNEDVAVLKVVMSLYADYPISLRYTFENMSAENLALIGEALFMACGYQRGPNGRMT